MDLVSSHCSLLYHEQLMIIIIMLMLPVNQVPADMDLVIVNARNTMGEIPIM